VSFDWPRLKVPPGDYAVAATAQRLTPHGYTVLAPREITMWITTRRGHPRVIAHKENYLKVMIPYIGPEQFSQRMHLFLFISGIGRAPRSPQLLADSLDPLRIGFVASLKTLPWRREVDEVMQTAGFRRTEQHGYVLWYRPAASAGLLIGALKTAVVAATGKTQKCAADAQRKPRRACLP
jgi:hypothetical protein